MMHTSVDETTGMCLDENLIGALLDGALSSAQRKQIEIHVDRCDECRGLVAELAGGGEATQPIHGAGDTQQEHSQSKPPPSWLRQLAARTSLLEPGDKIDHYSVIRLLGIGGMGEVYLARDAKLGRKVALKLVSERLLESPSAVQRFMREARATARVSHPHIVAIHAVGEHRGKPYLALEYVPGETLRQWMKANTTRSLREVLRIGLAILDALVEAHRHGILHRDLKPENVLVDERQRVRVVDFGLAEIVEAEEMVDTTVQRHDLGPIVTGIVGTPRYMAPEQWEEEERGGATDVWAFGLIVYELLSGRHPYHGVDDTMTLAGQICSGSPVPPLPERCAPRVLREVVARALHKRRDERPTADELATAFRQCAAQLEAASVLREQRRSRGSWYWIAGAILLAGSLAGVALLLRDDGSRAAQAVESGAVAKEQPPVPSPTARQVAVDEVPVAAPPAASAPAMPVHSAAPKLFVAKPVASAAATTPSAEPPPPPAPPPPPPPGDLLKEW